MNRGRSKKGDPKIAFFQAGRPGAPDYLRKPKLLISSR